MNGLGFDPPLDAPDLEPECPLCIQREAEAMIRNVVGDVLFDNGLMLDQVDDLVRGLGGVEFIEACGNAVYVRSAADGGRLCYLCAEHTDGD
jgi:hypothetical protein